MLEFAFGNVLRNPIRTILALLGIMIGVAAILSLVSVVDGVFFDINDVIGKVQGLRVVQKDSAGPLFSFIDSSFQADVEGITGVKGVVPLIAGSLKDVDGVASGTFSSGQIIGIDVEASDRFDQLGVNGELLSGRFLEPGDSGVVVIGEGIKDSTHKFVGNSIKLNGEKFKIVGIFSLGSSLLNNQVMMPIADARDLFSFPKNQVSAFIVALYNVDDEKEVSTAINFLLADDNLEAFSASDLSAMFGDVLDQLRLLVIVVAAISAIVAGVGIMNTMLMSIMERFQEIGVLKSIGWTRFDIIKMIVLESLFIGLLGGMLGILLGEFIAFIIQEVMGVTTILTPLLLLEAFVFAVFVSLLAGAYPAMVAANLDPIEALHYE